MKYILYDIGSDNFLRAIYEGDEMYSKGMNRLSFVDYYFDWGDVGGNVIIHDSGESIVKFRSEDINDIAKHFRFEMQISYLIYDRVYRFMQDSDNWSDPDIIVVPRIFEHNYFSTVESYDFSRGIPLMEW